MQKFGQTIKDLGLIIILIMSSFFSFGQQSAVEVEADTLVGRGDYSGALKLYNNILEKTKP
ncbi:MAG TPA: hypothetical protein VFZ52_16715, partial [Chryseolinea sp.]